MAKITILGAGVMGSAFSTPLADNGHTVNLVGTHVDGDIIEQIHEDRVHPGLKTILNKRVSPYTIDRLEEAVRGSDLVVLGVNSLGIDWASERLNGVLGEAVLSTTPLLFLTKGLEGKNEQLHILPDTLRNNLLPQFQQDVPMIAVGGPSIAGELAVRRQTSVVLTGTDPILLERIASYMRTPYYHVWTNTDMIGVEVCVALKNVYALAVGLAAGLQEKEDNAQGGSTSHAANHNTAAALFGQALWEMSYLVEHMGGEQRSVITLPGVGDLYVTCQGGRNSRMGRWLGLGWQYSEAKAEKMPTDTIEGAELALAIGPTITNMVSSGKLDGSRIPLLLTMIDIVCNDQIVEIPWDLFYGN